MSSYSKMYLVTEAEYKKVKKGKVVVVKKKVPHLAGDRRVLIESMKQCGRKYKRLPPPPHIINKFKRYR